MSSNKLSEQKPSLKQVCNLEHSNRIQNNIAFADTVNLTRTLQWFSAKKSVKNGTISNALALKSIKQKETTSMCA